MKSKQKQTKIDGKTWKKKLELGYDLFLHSYRSQRVPQIFQETIVGPDTWSSMKGFEKANVVDVLIIHVAGF